ncbi:MULTISPECIES: hypothetical protein [unclassified Tolypothrix]|uniref:hypothetical protein n=1 Tax=unclassified Tolypothrix TaxID=2649714 RepID=UPI00143AF625|nr:MULTISPECIES: hypothetical protein [unclassified Tolypothrix]MBE9083908.1 hypothetical protein [Tolypothrix sp. LEGE 11397]UYD38859.1 hypothetical protein HG267_40775 [Tolypothrix sp. PCC 7601]
MQSGRTTQSEGFNDKGLDNQFANSRHELRTPARMKISLSSQQSSVIRQHYLQVSICWGKSSEPVMSRHVTSESLTPKGLQK